jgi:hypothetical protein
MSTSGPPLPHPNLHKAELPLALVDISHLIRVHWKHGELRLSRNGSCRFDEPVGLAPAPQVAGTCYFGTSVAISFAESVLHEVVPSLQYSLTGWRSYMLSFTDKIAPRQVSLYRATDNAHSHLRLVDLCGAGLHNIGCTSTITSTLRDDVPNLYRYSQAWAHAIRQHPDKVDGIRFIPSHLNQHGYAIAIFEKAMPKLLHDSSTPLPLVSSSEPANDFLSLVSLFKLGFIESASQVDYIVKALAKAQ